MQNNQFDVIIVGAGLSGLTAGAYLSRADRSVLLLEKHTSVGGMLQSISRGGYVFDAGARAVENAGVLKPMLNDLGIDLELLKSSVSIGIEDAIVDMNSRKSIDRYGEILKKLYPESRKEVDRIFDSVDRVYKEMQVMYGFDNPVFKDLSHDRKYLIKKLLPWFGRFLLAVYRMEHMKEPVDSFLSSCTQNQSLVDIIDQHFFKKTPMFFALGYFYVYMDYLYPRGGTGTLPEKLKQKIIDCSGIVQCSTAVTAVDPAEKMITDESGQQYSYTSLLWAADLKTLYRIVDTSGLPEDAAKNVTKKSAQVIDSRGGDSVFSLYLGVAEPPETFAKIVNPHVFYTPNRKGLGETHLSDLETLISKGTAAAREEIYTWVRTYCALTTYEISIPSLRDHTLSPSGKTGIIVSFLLEYDLVNMIHAAGWYQEFKAYLEDEMIRTLNNSLFPGLLDTIEMKFSSSPISIERQFGNSEGGITGWTFLQQSPSVDRLLKIPSSVLTPIPSVFQCGQWTYSPAGIPTAILTGKYASEAILKQRKGEPRP